MEEPVGQSASAGGRLSRQELDLLLRDVDRLWSPPSLASRLIELVDADRLAAAPAIPDEALGLLASDPGMSAKVLSLARGAFGADVRTVEQAARELGPAIIRSLALSATAGTSPAGPGANAGAADEDEIDLPSLRRHCQAVAWAARMLAQTLGPRLDAEEAFLCGLLHDLGKLVLAQVLPKSYARAVEAARAACLLAPACAEQAPATGGKGQGDLLEHERSILGVDHAEAGRRIAERWQLPDAVLSAAWLHHQAGDALPPSLPAADLVAIVGLADAIARQAGIGWSGNPAAPAWPQEARRKLGLSDSAVADVAARLPEMVEAAARSAGLDLPVRRSAAPAELTRATAELGRWAERLCRQNAALSARAAVLDAVGELAATLSADAGLDDVLARLAHVAACIPSPGWNGDRAVVAYCLDLDDGTMLAASGGTGRPTRCRSFALAPTAMARQSPEPPAGDMSALSPPKGGPAALWTLLADPEEWSAWADLADYRHMPLCHGGRWLGGFFVPSEPVPPGLPGSRPRACPSGRPVGSPLGPGPGVDRPAGGGPQTRCTAFGGPDLGRRGEELRQTAAPILALILALAQQRRRAATVGEDLAEASRRLAQTREAAAEARALEAVGDMAAGAAHELNNPLAVVSGRAQIMRDKARSQEDRRAWQMIADQAQRVSDVISDLMEYASPRPPRFAELDPAVLLASAAEAFAASDHPQAAMCRVDIQVGEGTPQVRADAEQVRSVLVELLMNAATACGAARPAGDPRGRIRLAAEADPAGEAVVLTVRDDGPGLDVRTLGRVFTPFFSAQPAGRKRGLGLPKAKRYVENNGGRIRIDSRPGQGATVLIHLPCARRLAQRREDVDADHQGRPRAGGG